MAPGPAYAALIDTSGADGDDKKLAQSVNGGPFQLVFSTWAWRYTMVHAASGAHAVAAGVLGDKQHGDTFLTLATFLRSSDCGAPGGWCALPNVTGGPPTDNYFCLVGLAALQQPAGAAVVAVADPRVGLLRLE